MDDFAKLALTLESRKLIGLVRTVESEFAVFEETDGQMVETDQQPAGFQYFDLDGKLLEEISSYRLMMEDAYKDKYVYDKAGQLIERYEFDVNDKLLGKSTFEYAENNKLVEYHFFFSDEGILGLTSQPKLSSRIIYSEKGMFLEKDYYDEKGNIKPRLKYPIRKDTSRWIDPQTHEEIRFYDDKECPYRRIVTHFDAKGNELGFSVYEHDGSLGIQEAKKYEFDEIGNWISQVVDRWVVGWGEYRLRPYTITRRRIEYYD